jgi:O-methyltransferase
LLRKTASAIAKRIYRLTQAGSRHAVDSHLERHVVDQFVGGDPQRAALVSRIARVLEHVPSATRMLYHVVLARELLGLPREVEGDVVECGAYKGASSASLSIACSMVGRRLWVCDSFAGLPSAEADITRDYAHLRVQGRYAEGMYAGALDEVRANVAKYGEPASCEFVQGLFADSLRALPDKLAFAFIDVDLTSSMRDCIRHIWPRLADGGVIYTDDSCDMEVVRVWFDEAWWRETLGTRAPGYVGSGCGLPLALGGSSLGYVQKIPDVRKAYRTVSWLAT